MTVNKKHHELKRRFYQAALKTIAAIDRLPNDKVSQRLGDQLLRSSTSIIANYVEGQAAGTKKDFTYFLTIALKSANESKVWWALLRDSHRVQPEEANVFLKELDEVSRILGASIVTLKRNKTKT